MESPPAKKEAKNIFISHIHEESGIASAIKKELVKCFDERIQVFLSEAIPFGEDWQLSVIKNIENAHLILILFSPESIERPWINVEGGYGIISKKTVIPLFCLGAKGESLHYIYHRLAERT